MHLIFLVLILLLIAVILHHIFNRVPQLPHSTGRWGLGESDDPRIAVAGMMYAVATEYGPLSPEQERHILAQLTDRIGLDPNVARLCLTGGKRVARRLHGDLNSRLHQLLRPIESKCSPEEKIDVVEMLTIAAGANAQRIGPVRDGISRLSGKLLRS
jgi:hypothetical protein